MCGIVALLALEEHRLDPKGPITQQLDDALELIKHRGPDGRGVWIDPEGRCALAHCRLSILDPSPFGAQPLHSRSGHLHCIVNGELYSTPSLRASLASSFSFTSQSDSELALALYSQHGISFLSHLRGEFALVLYDAEKKLWIAARDRYGIKPLFWRRGPGRIELAAECKAFKGLGWEPEWDPVSIMEGGWEADSRTIFKGVQKLRPGHYMISRDGGEPEIRPYWEIDFPSKTTRDARKEEDLVLELREQLLDSVRLRLRADVPVGIYLSGGIDSSALAGMAAYLVKQEGLGMGSLSKEEGVRCFSIGFEDNEFDESAIAKRTADHLHVTHHLSLMTEETLADAFADAVYHIEHHAHDLNFVGKYVLSATPRQLGVKVVLTGEGADEHFGGYPLFLPDFLRAADDSRPDEAISLKRRAGIDGEEEIVKDSYGKMGARTDTFLSPARSRLVNMSTPSSITAFSPPTTLFHPSLRAILSDQTDPVDVLLSDVPPHVADKMRTSWHPLHSAQWIWTKTHLASQFLSCLGDRVEMAHSLEARTPFLDHKLTEFVNHLPPSTKIRLQDKAPGADADDTCAVEKWILREAVKPFVTDEVYKRRKHAYAAPVRYSKEGPVGVMMQGLLTRDKVEGLGFVDWAEIQRLMDYVWGGEQGGTQDADEEGARTWAWRRLLIVAGWVVLSDKMGIRQWTALQ